MRAVIALFISWGLLITVSPAEEIRDYYAEPGLNPFKETVNQNFHEHIDPFSGTLQLKYTDLIVPGNGGMDIHIHRVYTSLQEWELGVRRAMGVGWTMHFGRIVVPQAHVDKICNQSIWSVSVRDNPSLELPDGSRELLVLSTEGINTLVTKSNWKAVCGENGIGLVVTSPEGTMYVMDQRETTLDGDSRWYTRLIKDRHDNAIQITYKTDSLGALIIDHVTGGSITGGYDEFIPDGRMVQYEYLDEGTSTIRLHRITAPHHALEYHYTRLPNVVGDYYQLTEVIRPDGTRWKYDYYPQFTEFGQYGSHSLKTVTYPYGGHITYTYQGTEFDLDPLDFTITTTVATKTVSGPDSEAGTWTYTYDPGRWVDPDDPAQRRMDLTTVSGPEGTYRYFHYGYTIAPSGTLWQVGLLHIKEVYEGSALLEQMMQDWGTRLISNENYWHGRDPSRIDNETYAPMLLRTVHHRQGTNYITEHSGHDAFGNPHTIVQSSNLADDPAKTTHLTYYIDPVKWIVHQLEDETIEGIGTIDRSFDENGDLRSEVRYGVATTYTYTPQGDLATRTDARGNTVTYSDHHRGIAQREEHPEGVVITRMVNNSGTVASETDGRGNPAGLPMTD
jgi:YD repeat-containing protein